jgi:diguanylate cyclase (GGDEF)-like protein
MIASSLIGIWTVYWAINMHGPVSALALKVESLYAAYVVLHWRHVRRYPGYYPLRRIFTLLADQGACAGLMFVAGEMATFAIFANLWVTLGTGFRFGLKWMIASGAVAITSLIILGVVPGYWNQHVVWIVSLLVLNTIIPAYVGVLVRGLEEARAKLAQYANVMEKMALKDSLTGLPNRAALYVELDRACAHAIRHKSSIVLLYFDLDGFKKVNDAYGHAVGDLLLKETATRVGEILRADDVLARLGGDEYVALLQMHESNEHANLVANRILEAILSIDAINGRPVSVSASVGGVIVNGQDANRLGAEQLVHEADKNMYLAKNGGKSRVVLTQLVDESTYTHIPQVVQLA